MSVNELTLPKDVMCKALKDVMEIEFNAASESEVRAAEILLQKLSENSQVAEELADSIARHIGLSQAPSGIDTPLFHNVVLKRAEIALSADNFLHDDYPSESKAETEARYSTQVQSELPELSADLQFLEELLSMDKSYLTVSPAKLGFSPPSRQIDWSTGIENRWVELLHTAEVGLSRRTHTISLIREKFANRFSCSVANMAQNYSVFNLHAGPINTVAHFIFDPSTVYVLVVSDDHFSRFEVPVADSTNLARELIKAFDGKENYAKKALSCVGKSLMI